MILITGATGLVGTHLLAKLLEEYSSSDLKPLYRTESKKKYSLQVISEVYGASVAEKAKQCQWTMADVLDIPQLTDAFEKVTLVYHCAGFISNSPSDRRMIRKINTEGTENMVNLAIDFGVKKFLHVSSIATLGKPKEGIITSENNYKESLQNASFYSLSKFGGEMEVWRASQEGLSIVIVNPGVILGEGFYTTGSGKIFHEANKNIPFYLPKTTGFTDVRFLAQVMFLLMKSDISSERFIVVNENKDFGEVQKLIAKALGKRPPSIRLQKWMLYLMWFAELLTSFFRKRQLTRDVVEGVLESSWYENTKLNTALKTENSSIEASVNRVVAHYKNLK